MSKYEEASTNLITLSLEIMDIGEKLGKLKTADMDAMIATGFSDSKRINSTLKKVFGIEEMVAALRQSITKASLKAMVADDPVEPEKKKPAKVEEPKPEPEKKKLAKSVKEEPEKKSKPKKAGGKAETESDDESTVSDTKPLHVRRKKIPKHIRTLVWNEHIGSSVSENLCCCCKKEKIDVRNFHCGHVIAEVNGGDLTIPNLRPICPPCNSAMGTRSMNEFMKEFFGRSL